MYQNSRTNFIISLFRFGFVAESSSSSLRLGVAKLGTVGGKCLLCGKSFSAFTSAKRHYQLVHLEERLVECHVCKKFYKGDVGLRQHLRANHGIYQSMMKDMQFPQQQNFWTKNEDCFPFYTDLEGLCCVIVAKHDCTEIAERTLSSACSILVLLQNHHRRRYDLESPSLVWLEESVCCVENLSVHLRTQKGITSLSTSKSVWLNVMSAKSFIKATLDCGSI